MCMAREKLSSTMHDNKVSTAIRAAVLSTAFIAIFYVALRKYTPGFVGICACLCLCVFTSMRVLDVHL